MATTYTLEEINVLMLNTYCDITNNDKVKHDRMNVNIIIHTELLQKLIA